MRFISFPRARVTAIKLRMFVEGIAKRIPPYKHQLECNRFSYCFFNHLIKIILSIAIQAIAEAIALHLKYACYNFLNFFIMLIMNIK